MKKTLVSMLTGALVVGAASTTFAATNPFSDVPADSWAYDAVAKLAADGVVNGFPDGTFRGNQEMTRYQMAQIVAKAMTYENLTKADKALVNKLAAEFSNELQNLGVRVANLEKKSDNVKWEGDMQYTYSQVKMPSFDTKTKRYKTGDKQVEDNTYAFSLKPTAFIHGTNWAVKSKIKYSSNANQANNAATKVDRIYAEGNLLNLDTKLGKLPTYSDNTLGSGMVMDDNISGAQFSKAAGSITATAAIGRYQYDESLNQNNAFAGSGTYGSFELGYAPKDSKVKAVAGYYTLRNIKNGNQDNVNQTSFWDNSFDSSQEAYLPDTNGSSITAKLSPKGNKKTVNDGIWTAGLGYTFDKNVNMYGIYGKSNLDADKSYKGDDQSKAYDITVNYKGADMAKAGSWGAHFGYRYLGAFATIAPTYDGSQRGTKGWEIGTEYTIAPNILATLIYFDGKVLATDFANNDSDYKKIYANLKFAF